MTQDQLTADDAPAFEFGMNWRTDVTDWVGGYPYECATVQEIFDFVRQTFPDFLLEGLKSTRGLGTNWFLFRRVG